MRNNIFILIFIGILSSGYAWASDVEANWIEIADSQIYKYYGKRESGGFINVDGKKKNGYGYVWQLENKNKKHLIMVNCS